MNAQVLEGKNLEMQRKQFNYKVDIWIYKKQSLFYFSYEADTLLVFWKKNKQIYVL